MEINELKCECCNNQKSCTKICEGIEKLLPKPRSGGHRKEFQSTPHNIEYIHQYNISQKNGKRVQPIIYSDNYEY